MCGRIARTSPHEVLAKEFGITTFVNVDLNPRYNVAQSQHVEAIIRHGEEGRLGPMRWGFAASNLTVAPINARAETVATSLPAKLSCGRFASRDTRGGRTPHARPHSELNLDGRLLRSRSHGTGTQHPFTQLPLQH